MMENMQYIGHYNYLESHDSELNNDNVIKAVVFKGTKTIKDKGKDLEVMVKKAEILSIDIVIERFDRGFNFYTKTPVGEYDEVAIHIKRDKPCKMFNRNFDVAYLSDVPKPDLSNVDLQDLINKFADKVKGK